jgi:hypothetical protein
LGRSLGSSVYFQIWKARLCQIKNSIKIGKKIRKKKGGMVLTVGDDVWGCCFRVQCVFPNIESEAVPHEK